METTLFLIEKNPLSLTAVNRKGRTALHIAARFGKESVIKALLKRGADCNATDIHGDTPLHFAAKYLPYHK